MMLTISSVVRKPSDFPNPLATRFAMHCNVKLKSENPTVFHTINPACPDYPYYPDMGTILTALTALSDVPLNQSSQE